MNEYKDDKSECDVGVKARWPMHTSAAPAAKLTSSHMIHHYISTSITSPGEDSTGNCITDLMNRGT
jgi:hypothetical protein